METSLWMTYQKCPSSSTNCSGISTNSGWQFSNQEVKVSGSEGGSDYVWFLSKPVKNMRHFKTASFTKLYQVQASCKERLKTKMQWLFCVAYLFFFYLDVKRTKQEQQK